MKTIRLAILISGSGSTAEAVIRACQNGTLEGIIPVVVISSSKDAVGLGKAHRCGIETKVIEKNNLLQTLITFGVDVVSQNGWLPLTPPSVVDAYKGRIINQHPGPLDPGYLDFGGKGMYGRRVTAARLAYAQMSGSDYFTEATTHHVTAEYDKGEIIRIERLPFSPDVSTNTLASKLLPLEHQNVIASLRAYAKDGCFPVFKRKKRLVSKGKEAFLVEAKKLAISLFP